MNPTHAENLIQTALSLFEASCGLFWASLPVAFLLAIAAIYIRGDISSSSFEALFRRLLLAIMLLVAFPKISEGAKDFETYLVTIFGGETPLSDVFSRVADRAREVKDAESVSWIKVGNIALSLITTLSFLVLAVVKHFLDMLHLTIWNLLHILGPIALLGCLFPTWHQVPKGIFAGLLELSLWKPVWVILARILLAVGFGETPSDPTRWFDTAVVNFAVAALMASTPILVHGFLSGNLAPMGGSMMQTMVSGAGTALAKVPVMALQFAAQAVMKVPLKSTGAALSQSSRLIGKSGGISPTRSAAPSRTPRPRS